MTDCSSARCKAELGHETITCSSESWCGTRRTALQTDCRERSDVQLVNLGSSTCAPAAFTGVGKDLLTTDNTRVCTRGLRLCPAMSPQHRHPRARYKADRKHGAERLIECQVSKRRGSCTEDTLCGQHFNPHAGEQQRVQHAPAQGVQKQRHAAGALDDVVDGSGRMVPPAAHCPNAALHRSVPGARTRATA